MKSDTQFQIGKIIESGERDAVHIAVLPATASKSLGAGQHVGFKDGKSITDGVNIGIVDPFLVDGVAKGQMFYIFLYPNTITSLRHLWTHPDIPDTTEQEPSAKSFSEKWMRRWAMQHMSDDYYGDGKILEESVAYESAIQAGYDLSVGAHESARDHIDDEWWNHWENITGVKGKRNEGFSCSC